ncbi:MAG: DNA-directed RNA polymerase subunit alpha [Vampirovibrionales bacterium]
MDHPLTIKCVNTTTASDGSIYGKFVIEPLNRGYGTTLGNSLRRVLLSSLEGTAITSVKIEGASHEYTPIPGVKEDCLDILLNLKGVVLKSLDHDTHVLTLQANKTGAVLAGEIECPPEVKVMNPNYVICHLNEGASVAMEMTCETGKGYVAADAQHVGKVANVLTLDASYMPIRRVAYLVEDTRVGQKTDYDRLVLEIWSDGSIDVTSALSQSASMLIDHLVPIASLDGIPKQLAPQAQEVEAEEKQVPSITIEDLELSVRAFNCLKRANIHDMEELLQKSEADLLSIKNFGKKSSDEVIERLAAFGLYLKPNPEGVILPTE